MQEWLTLGKYKSTRQCCQLSSSKEHTLQKSSSCNTSSRRSDGEWCSSYNVSSQQTLCKSHSFLYCSQCNCKSNILCSQPHGHKKNLFLILCGHYFMKSQMPEAGSSNQKIGCLSIRVTCGACDLRHSQMYKLENSWHRWICKLHLWCCVLSSPLPCHHT